MTKTTSLILFFLLMGVIIIFLATSRSKLKKEAHEIYQELVEVKEEATHKVKRIEELKNSLEEVVAKHKHEEAQVYQQAIAECNAFIQALNRASENTKDWMDNLDPGWATRPPQDIVAYLKTERKKIHTIMEEVEKAIKDAEKALISSEKVVEDIASEIEDIVSRMDKK